MAERQFPSNSNKSKAHGPVSGNIEVDKTGKDKLLGAIFAKDIVGGLTNLFWKTIVPRIKGVFLSSVHDSVNTIFDWNGSTNSNGKANYHMMSNGGYAGQTVSTNSNYQQITSNVARPTSNVLTFQTEEDAINCRNFMIESIAACQLITVNQLYGYLSRPIEHVWNKYGWININEQNAPIYQQGNGWCLKLPKAAPIDN